MATKSIAGVYILRCANDNRVYVGSSVDIHRRFLSHIGFLRRGNHANRNLQMAAKAYGLISFSVEVVEECDVAILRVREQHHLNRLMQTEEGVFNISKYTDCSMRGRTGESNPFFGCRHTEKTKSALSSMRIGKPLCTAVREKMSAAKKGKPRQWHTGKPLVAVRCVETGVAYESVSHAARAHGKDNPSSIFDVLKGRQKRAFGFHWELV